MSTSEGPVHAVLDAYRVAVHEKDVAAFTALYDDDVHVFDMWGEWSYRGIDAWRAMAVGWFGSLGTERVVVRVDDLQVRIVDDLATAHADLAFAAVSAEGHELRAMNNRMTLILVKRGGAWKIVHEHTSAPIDFKTAKVMLQR